MILSFNSPCILEGVLREKLVSEGLTLLLILSYREISVRQVSASCVIINEMKEGCKQ